MVRLPVVGLYTQPVTWIKHKKGVEKESGISLDIELPIKFKADEDVELRYLIGNSGKNTVWIIQNSLVPAHLTCKVSIGKREVAQLDGEELKMLLDLYPERKPVALNPGEYLSFKHTIITEQLKLKKNCYYNFKISISPEWYPTSTLNIDDLKKNKLESNMTILTN